MQYEKSDYCFFCFVFLFCFGAPKHFDIQSKKTVNSKVVLFFGKLIQFCVSRDGFKC